MSSIGAIPDHVRLILKCLILKCKKCRYRFSSEKRVVSVD